MAARPALIAAGIAGTLALGTAGYFANESRVCSELKADYRAFAIGALADQQLKNSTTSPQVAGHLKKKMDADIMRGGETLFRLGQRCGESAALQAQADAQALILGI